MSIELRDNDGSKVGGFLERLTLRLGRLSDRAVEDEDRHIGLDRLADLDHLLKQLAFLSVPSRRVDDDDLEPLGAELGHACSGDGDGVCLGVAEVWAQQIRIC